MTVPVGARFNGHDRNLSDPRHNKHDQEPVVAPSCEYRWMDTSEFTKHGLITPEHAPRAIQVLEGQADELRVAGDGFSALVLDRIANELRNRLSDGWGRPGDGPISATFSSEKLPDGMIEIACRLGPSPRRRRAPIVS